MRCQCVTLSEHTKNYALNFSSRNGRLRLSSAKSSVLMCEYYVYRSHRSQRQTLGNSARKLLIRLESVTLDFGFISYSSLVVLMDVEKSSLRARAASRQPA